MEYSNTRLREIVADFVHDERARRIMIRKYQDNITLERIAEECMVDVSTVKRTINRCSFIYKYLPESDPKLNRK